LCSATTPKKSGPIGWTTTLAVKEGPDFAFDEEETMNNTAYKTFKLHLDQKEIVDAALALAREKGGTTVDTVALEYVAQEFMGTGMNFPTLKAAMMAEKKKAGTEEDFLGVVAGLLDEILVENVASISIEPKE